MITSTRFFQLRLVITLVRMWRGEGMYRFSANRILKKAILAIIFPIPNPPPRKTIWSCLSNLKKGWMTWNVSNPRWIRGSCHLWIARAWATVGPQSTANYRTCPLLARGTTEVATAPQLFSEDTHWIQVASPFIRISSKVRGLPRWCLCSGSSLASPLTPADWYQVLTGFMLLELTSSWFWNRGINVLTGKKSPEAFAARLIWFYQACTNHRRKWGIFKFARSRRSLRFWSGKPSIWSRCCWVFELRPKTNFRCWQEKLQYWKYFGADFFERGLSNESSADQDRSSKLEANFTSTFAEGIISGFLILDEGFCGTWIFRTDGFLLIRVLRSYMVRLHHPWTMDSIQWQQPEPPSHKTNKPSVA